MAQLPTHSSGGPCLSLLVSLESCCSSAVGTMCSQILLHCLLATRRVAAPCLSLLRSMGPCRSSTAATT